MESHLAIGNKWLRFLPAATMMAEAISYSMATEMAVKKPNKSHRAFTLIELLVVIPVPHQLPMEGLGAANHWSPLP